MHAVGTMSPALPAAVLVIHSITPGTGNDIAALVNLQSAAGTLSCLVLVPEHELSFFRGVETANTSLCFKQNTSKPYGKMFLRCLEPMPITSALDEVSSFMAAHERKGAVA